MLSLVNFHKIVHSQFTWDYFLTQIIFPGMCSTSNNTKAITVSVSKSDQLVQ